MKKVVFALGGLFLITFIAGYKLINSRPPINSRFSESTATYFPSEIADNTESSPAVTTVEFIIPKDSALVPQSKHVYQTFNNCGPAALSMILGYHGINKSQKELGDLMRPYQNPSGDNDDKSIFIDEFVLWAQKNNINAIARINGDIELLKKFTSNGFPVVVKTWLHLNDDIGHFRIVRGFDDKAQVIIQDDSYEGPNRKIRYFDFLSMWQPFNYEYVIVYQDKDIDLVNSILGQESDAMVAYENALLRAKKENELDKNNPYPIFNMSMSQFHLGQIDESIKTFELVEKRLPPRMLWYQIEPLLAYQKQQKYDRVFEISNRILNNGNRAFSELYQIRGEIFMEQGKPEQAKTEFEKAVLYNKNFEPAQISLKEIDSYKE